MRRSVITIGRLPRVVPGTLACAVSTMPSTWPSVLADPCAAAVSCAASVTE